MEIHDALVHALLHRLGRAYEAHEVNRLGSAAHAEGQLVFSRFLDQRSGHRVAGNLLGERGEGMVFHAHERRVVEDGCRNSRRAQMRQRVDVEVDREVHLAVGPLDIGGQELGLEIHELLIGGDSSGGDVEAVQIGHVAIAIDITGLPDVLTVGIDEGDVDPELRLGAERTGWQIVARVRVLDPVREAQVAADLAVCHR